MTQQIDRTPAVPARAPVPAPAPSRHGPAAQLLMALSPLGLVLAGYAVAQWLTGPLADGGPRNRLGLPLHVTGPADADRALLGGVPTPWLQEHLATGSAQWYDAVVALVYATHFVGLPAVTVLVWLRWRHRLVPWLLAVTVLTTSGYAGYVLYPAAPPWDAAERGLLAPVERISTIGWEVLHLEPVGRLVELGQQASNPVAAMPSLHAGVAMLIALHLGPVARPAVRLALAGYAVAMGLALVYTGEHYVVDVLAGWALAALATLVALATSAATSLRSRRVPPPSPAARGRGGGAGRSAAATCRRTAPGARRRGARAPRRRWCR